MPLVALGLALGAALLHALWNTLLAREGDSTPFTAVALGAGVVVFAPVALLDWRVEPSAWPIVALSGGVETLYFFLLGAAYRRSDLSLVYPLARGLAPVFVLLFGVTVAGLASTPLEVVGVLLVAVGVLLLRGLRGPRDTPGVLLGALIAGCIAGYTLIDRVGLQRASNAAYLWLVFLPPAVAYLAVTARLRGIDAIRRAVRPPAVLAGALMLAAYGLVLAALRLAPAASVAAVRESSVVIAMVLAALVLHERVSRGRFGGALLVAGGIVLLALT